jgi:hypothetical protein
MHQTDGLAITGDRVGRIMGTETVTLGWGAVVTCNTLPDVFSRILAPCGTATISYVLSSEENNTNVASGSPQVETYREVGTELARWLHSLNPDTGNLCNQISLSEWLLSFPKSMY